MKWIRNRNKFLNEAKLRDVILPTQAKAVAAKWGEKYLDYEEIQPTAEIEQGRWKLSYEDKMAAFSTFMSCDMEEVLDLFKELPKAFVDFVSMVSSDETVKDININKPTLDQLVFIFNPVFKKISVNDTLSNSIISKDDNGRPIKDEEGNMVKIEKIPGELALSNNLVNIQTTIDDYNSLVTKYVENNIGDKYVSTDLLDDKLFDNSELQKYVSSAKNDENSSYHWKYDVEIFEKDIYLSIQHNPKAILNMSISKFYSSCQHLYSGVCRSQLLANVFDPNSIPAFLLFDTPIFNKDGEKIADVMPLTRMQIRKVETFDTQDESGEIKRGESKLYFDRSYPDRMEDILPNLVEKYTSNKKLEGDINDYNYVYSPDFDRNDENVLDTPYHDNIGDKKIKHKKRLGLNIKTLDLKDLQDWSNVIIMPNTKIKHLIIETTVLPENMLDIKLDLEWIKFKYLKLETLEPFSKISYDSIAFEKCKFDNNIFSDIAKNTPHIKRINLTSCDNQGVPNFSEFKNLEELHFLYTLDSIEELQQAIQGVNLKVLGVSGDLVTSQTKSFFNSLKSKGIKIDIVGPSL